MISVGALTLLCTQVQAAPLSVEEIQAAVNYWNTPGRYEVLPSRLGGAPVKVRQTPEGSLWLWAYQLKQNNGKDVGLTYESTQNSEWDAWIQAKLNYDKYLASLNAQQLNKALGSNSTPLPAAPAPGSIPEKLKLLVGDAPSFYTAVAPKLHRIRYGDNEVYEFEDNPETLPNFLKFRFAEGVRHFGTPVRQLETQTLSWLFNNARITPSEQKIFKSVSLLEGGFDSINTYDTGWVSVGFIQFACMPKGSGSLGQVLLKQKTEDPGQFFKDFEQYGVDVTTDGQLVAVDIENKRARVGSEAAKLIIADKRLTSVFHRAGKLSDSFRTAQLKVAKEQYFPAEDVVTLKLNGKQVTAKVKDFVRSEAGLATLMDRKVKSGSVGPLKAVAEQVAQNRGCKTLADLAKYEYEIVQSMTLRKNFLLDDSLTKPNLVATTQTRGNVTSRKATTVRKPAKKAPAQKVPVKKSAPKKQTNSQASAKTKK
jgi:hypothetical protein